MDDEIKKELAKLNATKGFVSPVNFLGEDKYERTGVTGRGNVRKSTLARDPKDIDYLIKRGEKHITLDRDHEVEKIIKDLEFSERQLKPKEPTLESFKKKERSTKKAPPQKKSQIAALQRMDAGPLTSETRSAYEFSDEMKRELKERNPEFCHKIDEEKKFTNELVKWQNMEKAARK